MANINHSLQDINCVDLLTSYWFVFTCHASRWMWNARSRWSALVTPCIALYWNRLSYRQVVPRPTYHSVLQHSRNIMTQRYSQLFINVCMRMLTNNWFLASKFERVLHCHYTLEWSRAMCLFPQIKCFCSDSYWNKVQLTGWMGG